MHGAGFASTRADRRNMNDAPIKVAVLLSGSGTTLQNLIDQIAAKQLEAQIELVIASRDGVVGITRAQAAKLPVKIIARKSFADRATFSNAVFEAIDAAKVDLVCLAGWLSLLDVPARWLGRIMNIHPSLLPKFGGVGMYGHRVHEAVLAANETVSGCTVHYVDNTCDGGPMILQRRCEVLPNDTPTTLAARVFEEERIAYPEAIRQHVQTHGKAW